MCVSRDYALGRAASTVNADERGSGAAMDTDSMGWPGDSLVNPLRRSALVCVYDIWSEPGVKSISRNEGTFGFRIADRGF